MKDINRLYATKEITMIKPNELRIGNCVRYLGEMQQVVGIDPEHVYLDTISIDYIEHDEIEPIELDHSVLVNLGFESDSVLYKIVNNRFIFKLCFFDGWNLYYKEKESFGTGEVNLLGFWSAHELQNLYYALTNEELVRDEL